MQLQEIEKFARKNNILVTVEFDVMLYKGKVRCYHKDSIPSLLGQDKSCAEKLQLESTLELSEILEKADINKIFVNGKKVVIASPSSLKGTWRARLNKDNLHLEIGCGKGDDFTHIAAMYPA